MTLINRERTLEGYREYRNERVTEERNRRRDTDPEKIHFVSSLVGIVVSALLTMAVLLGTEVLMGGLAGVGGAVIAAGTVSAGYMIGALSYSSWAYGSRGSSTQKVAKGFLEQFGGVSEAPGWTLQHEDFAQVRTFVKRRRLSAAEAETLEVIAEDSERSIGELVRVVQAL